MLLPAQNTLFYGDNFDILRNYFPEECIDLIYLDPPFNSQRPYNILFRERNGNESRAQTEAFNDMWTWNSIRPDVMLQHIHREADPKLYRLIGGMIDAIGETPLMAYIVMMTARLIELHRVLKPTGSFYLHCDPNASHYLKLVLDTIFGSENFQNEIIWKRTSAHNDAKQGKLLHMGRIHDVILYYTRSSEAQRTEIYSPHDPTYIEKFYKYTDLNGRKYTLDNITGPGGAAKGNPIYEFLGVTRYWRYSREKMQKLYEEGRIIQTKANTVPRYKRYLDEMLGIPLQDLWTDITPVAALSTERLGYPTQKPIALLERIIQASSNPDEIVLDPFCGCGTAVAAAEKLGRRWYGIDVTHLAIAVQESRMKDMFPSIKFHVEGVPKDLESARAMATRDFNGRSEFQYWAVSLVGGYPFGSQDGKKGKKGKDRGIDGYYTFYDESDERRGKDVVIQVKSGKVKSGDVRDLRGTMEREGATIGLFLTLEEPTSEMKLEAYRAGEYTSLGWNTTHPRLQILTIEDLLTGKVRPDVPARTLPHKQATKIAPRVSQQTMNLSGD